MDDVEFELWKKNKEEEMKQIQQELDSKESSFYGWVGFVKTLETYDLLNNKIILSETDKLVDEDKMRELGYKFGVRVLDDIKQEKIETEKPENKQWIPFLLLIVIGVLLGVVVLIFALYNAGVKEPIYFLMNLTGL